MSNLNSQPNQEASIELTAIPRDTETSLKALLALLWLDAPSISFVEHLTESVVKLYDGSAAWRNLCAQNEEKFRRVMEVGIEVTHGLFELEDSRSKIQQMPPEEQAAYFEQTVRPLTEKLRLFVKLVGGTFIQLNCQSSMLDAQQRFKGLTQHKPENLSALIEQNGELLRDMLVYGERALVLFGMSRGGEASTANLGKQVQGLAVTRGELLSGRNRRRPLSNLEVHAPEVLTTCVIEVIASEMRGVASEMRNALRTKLAHVDFTSEEPSEAERAQFKLLLSDAVLSFRSPNKGALAIGIATPKDDFESLGWMKSRLAASMEILQKLSPALKCSVSTQVVPHPNKAMKDVTLYECVLSFTHTNSTTATSATPLQALKPYSTWEALERNSSITRLNQERTEYRIGLSPAVCNDFDNLPKALVLGLDEISTSFPGEMSARISYLDQAGNDYQEMLEDPAINFENPDDDAHAGQLDESGNWDSDDGNSDIDGASERAPSTNSPRQYLVTLTNTTATAQDARLLNQRTIQRLYQRLCFLSVQGSEGLKYDTLPLISPEPLVPNIMISEEVLQNKTVRDHLARIFKRVLPGKIRLPTRTNDAAKLLTAVEAQLNAFLGSSEQDDKLTLVLTTAQLSEQENGTVHIIPAKLRLLNAAAHTVLSGAYEPNDDRFEVFPVSYDVLKSLTVAAVASMKELRKEGLPVQMWRLGQELSTRGFEVYDQLLLQLNTFANDFAPGTDDDSALHDRAFRYIESACLRASVSAPRKNGTTLELRLKEP